MSYHPKVFPHQAAFPEDSAHDQPGLTKLEFFAGCALAGMASRVPWHRTVGGPTVTPLERAELALAYAEAMIQKLNELAAPDDCAP